MARLLSPVLDATPDILALVSGLCPSLCDLSRPLLPLCSPSPLPIRVSIRRSVTVAGTKGTRQGYVFLQSQ